MVDLGDIFEIAEELKLNASSIRITGDQLSVTIAGGKYCASVGKGVRFGLRECLKTYHKYGQGS